MAVGNSGLEWWVAEQKQEKERQECARKREEQARKYFWLNVVLMLLALVGGGLWYFLHIEPMLRGTTILGGLLLALGFLRLVQRSTSTDDATLIKRLLIHPQALSYLLFACGVVLLLLLATRSVYVEYQSGTGHSAYKLEVYRDQELFMEPLTVSSYKKVDGRIFFARDWPFRSWELKLRVKSPPYLYDELPVSVRWPWDGHVDVPGKFATKAYRVFRVLPGQKFLNLNIREDNPSDTRYRLHVFVRDPAGDDVELCQTNYFYEPIYFGGDAALINHLQQLEDRDREKRWRITGHLRKLETAAMRQITDAKRQETMKESFAHRRNVLLTSQTVRDSAVVDDTKAKIVIRVQKRNGPQWELDKEYTFDVQADAGIQNLILN